jgi:hypothetical protein
MHSMYLEHDHERQEARARPGLEGLITYFATLIFSTASAVVHKSLAT